MAERGELDDTTMTEHTELFVPWTPEDNFAANDLRSWEGVLYRCVQSHAGQENWTPDQTPAMWVKIGDPREEWPAWSRPIGAHDAYGLGAKVSHATKHWISEVEENVWQPGVYGWRDGE
jgi:hypothetical protein